jgi:hypothetical protein
MPSPFPGMDPILEDPSLFPEFRFCFVMQLMGTINAMIPAPYYAARSERIWAIVKPDVVQDPTGNAELLDPLSVLQIDGFPDNYHEIRAMSAKGHQVFTAIDVFGVLHKSPELTNRASVVQSPRPYSLSTVNHVEIDLLREGVHATSIPWARLKEKVGKFEYHVCIQRGDQPDDFAVFPIRQTDRLPIIPIPITPKVEPIFVDLQLVLDRCFDSGAYTRRPIYRAQLASMQMSRGPKWAEQILREKGLLP